MSTTNTAEKRARKTAPRVNIRISKKAHRALAAKAKREGRDMIATLDFMLAV